MGYDSSRRMPCSASLRLSPARRFFGGSTGLPGCEQFEFGEQLRVRLKLTPAPLVRRLRLGAHESLRRSGAVRDVGEIKAMPVDLLVQMLAAVFAEWESAHWL